LEKQLSLFSDVEKINSLFLESSSCTLRVKETIPLLSTTWNYGWNPTTKTWQVVSRFGRIDSLGYDTLYGAVGQTAVCSLSPLQF
jgi:hypothetical protein